ncbi:MAG: NYN domain-containing protein [Dehalococcoidia bacterium]
MALNIGRRAARNKTEPAQEAPAAAPEEAPVINEVAPAAVEAETEAAPEVKPRARRGTRSTGTGTGTSRSRKAAPAEPALEEPVVAPPLPEAVIEPAAEAEAGAVEVVALPEAEVLIADESAMAQDAAADDEGEARAEGDERPGRRRRRGRGGRGGGRETQQPRADGEFFEPTEARAELGAPEASEPAADASLSTIMRSLEYHNRQIERLVRMQEDLARRVASSGSGAGSVAQSSVAQRQRVGIFVDSANIELALDRMRNRIDWKRVLDLLCKDRVLVKAIAYSPVHDDPAVSIETQRFVEPFLDSGFKVVTKPLKRFADGSIKANIDVELAMDVMTMVDRLDVVVIVSGDGDFQRLVEVTQAKGVRVEVASVQSSTASNLRHAADLFYDLGRLPGR